MCNINSRILKTCLFSFYLILISACSSTNQPKNLDINSNEFIDAMLIQKSSEAVNAQQQYTMLVAENREQKTQKHNLFDNEEIDIIGFIGKPNILLKALANRYGYEYSEVGTNRNNLPTITVDIKKQTPIEVLKMISYQIDKIGELVLDKDAKVIRLVFKN